MILSDLPHSALSVPLLAISQVEIHRENVKAANESFLFIAGAFAIVGAMGAYLFWCDRHATQRTKTWVADWVRQEGLELVSLEPSSGPRTGLFAPRVAGCIWSKVIVKDRDGAVKTAFVLCAGALMALIAPKVVVIWDPASARTTKA